MEHKYERHELMVPVTCCFFCSSCSWSVVHTSHHPSWHQTSEPSPLLPSLLLTQYPSQQGTFHWCNCQTRFVEQLEWQGNNFTHLSSVEALHLITLVSLLCLLCNLVQLTLGLHATWLELIWQQHSVVHHSIWCVSDYNPWGVLCSPSHVLISTLFICNETAPFWSHRLLKSSWDSVMITRQIFGA